MTPDSRRERMTDIERLGRRGWLAAVGAVLVAAGLVLALSGASPDGSPSGVRLVGILSLLGGVVLAVAGVRGSSLPTRSPTVEDRARTEPVGRVFEERVVAAGDADEQVRPAVRSTVRERLRALARDTLASRPDTDRDEALTMLGRGSWTDDESAAAFLGANTDAKRSRSLPSFDERARRAVDALLTVGTDDATEPTWTDTETDTTNWRDGTRTTDHWRGFGALVLFAFAGAALTRTPGLVVVAAVLLGVVGYVRLTRLPDLDVHVERTFDTDQPGPGDTVVVRVTVTNEGDAVLSDLRLVDGVPDRLAVVEDTPRHATALVPGGSTTFTYEVLAVAGDHDFEQTYVTLRDASGHRERTATVSTETDTLSCDPSVVRESVPLHPQTTSRTGHIPDGTGESGQTFHSIREYRRGDSLRRVDWNRVARTGTLSTVEFYEEHAATVVLLVDSRPVSSRAPDRRSLSALDRSLAGASQLFTTLAGDGDRVGIASISADPLWIPPGAGTEHETRVRRALAGDGFDTDAGTRFDAESYVDILEARLPAEAQVVVLSPLLDDETRTVLRQLQTRGHGVTVLSPDPTTTATVGGAVAHLERQHSLDRLRGERIRVADWPAGEGLAEAVDRAARGWNA